MCKAGKRDSGWLDANASLDSVFGRDEHRGLIRRQRLLTAPGTGLALLMLLALGTFVAGVHIAWQICILGLIMALAVPAIAWLTSYALFLTLAAAALSGLL